MKSCRLGLIGSSILATLVSVAAIIDHLGEKPGPTIRWLLVLIACAAIGGAFYLYPRHPLPGNVKKFFREYHVGLLRLLCVVLLLGGFTVFLTPTTEATLTPPPAVTPSPSATITVTPSLTTTPSPSATVTSTPSPTVTPTAEDPLIIQDASTATQTPEPTIIFHVVKQDEHLWCLAQMYYGPGNGHLFKYICRHNQASGQIGDDCNELQVGEKLQIPIKKDFAWSEIPDQLPPPGTAEGVDYFCSIPTAEP